VSNLCKLSNKELVLLAIKVLQERGAKKVTDTYIKSVVLIIRKMCELLGEEQPN